MGFFTLLAAKLAGPAGRVIAVEPLPRNLELLRQHVSLNRVQNVTVLPLALADAPGTTRLDIDQSPSMGRIGAEAGVEVDVSTVDALVGEGLPAPDVIKMDIEGAESRALAGARQTLAEHRPMVPLSTHGYAQHEKCLAMLAAWGYRTTLRRDGSADGQYELIARPA